MTPRLSASCERRRLQQSLDDGLSESEEAALAAHLTDCPSCRAALEELAAGPLHWQRVGEVLRDQSASDSSMDPGAGSSELDETLGLRHGRVDYAARPLDFAVDFLNPPTAPDSIGRLGEIDIQSVIGHGGMGIVLKGLQPALNRFVAVKVLAPHLATSGAARQRFAREARAAAAVVHPHVMPIFTVDASGRLPYLVMPLIDGESLQERIDRQGALEAVDVLRIGLQVARGLAAAHAQGLVHRDIKPANILLERGIDRVVLTDFGLARAADDASLTRSGLIAGTPQYMSPEQARGDGIDARSDLFSLGSVLYTMCTGRPPFRADTSYGILRRIIDTEPRPIRDCQPALPRWLEYLVNRLLAKSPDARYGSAEVVAEIMEKCLAHVQQPSGTRIPSELLRRAPQAQRRALAIFAGLGLTIAVAGTAAWTSWPTPPESDATRSSASALSAPSTPDVIVPPDDASLRPPGELPHSTKADDAQVDRQLEQLRHRIFELQQRVDQFW
jgi:serine/threonine-protein kinase